MRPPQAPADAAEPHQPDETQLTPTSQESDGRAGANRGGRLASLPARWRGIPPLVRAATLAFAALMVCFMYLYPVNYGFDEPQHFDMAYAYATGHGFYGPGERTLATDVHNVSTIFSRGYPPGTAFADEPIVGRAGRRALIDYGGDSPTAVANQMVQHPPLYYLLAAVVIDLPGVSHLPYDVEFTLLRFLSLLLLLPLPWLCYAAARRLGAGGLAPSAALLPLLLPSLARLGASVTNDSLMLLTAGVALYLVCRVVTGDGTARTAVYLGIAVLAALLTKGFGLLLPLIAVLAYLTYWLRFRAGVPVRQLVTVCGFSALGGLWWLRNLILYGAVQPDGFGPGYVDAIYQRLHPGPTRGSLRPFFDAAWRALVDRFWGSIGLVESPDYNWTFIWTAMVVAGAALVLGVFRGARDSEPRWRRLAVLVPLLMLPLSAALLVAGAWPNYHRYVLLTGVQGRYLFPALVPAAAVAMLGIGFVVRERGARFVPIVLVACALYAQTWTAWTLTKAWWLTAKPVSTRAAWQNALHVILNWAPWPVGVSVLVAVLAVAAAGGLIWQAVRAATGGREPGIG